MSQKFAELHLPNLYTEDQEILTVSYDSPIPYIVPSSEDKEDLKRVLQQAQPEEKAKTGGIVSKFKGDKIEVQAQQKIRAELKNVSPKVVIPGFKYEDFCKFTTGRAEENQEFDIIVLIAQSRVFLVLEVKSEETFSKKDLEKIEKTSER